MACLRIREPWRNYSVNMRRYLFDAQGDNFVSDYFRGGVPVLVGVTGKALP